MVIGLIKLYFFVIMEGGITVYYKQQMVELVGISTLNEAVLRISVTVVAKIMLFYYIKSLFYYFTTSFYNISFIRYAI